MLVTKALSQDVTNLAAFVPLAEEAARRSPTGSFALCESVATATTKRVAWNGNQPLLCRRPILYLRAIDFSM
ncbi:hypothetical protein ABE61_14635 [Lysinibacillus sphaericus]|nr:hypothetical protein [Lysinibacillus sphaericus]MBG9478799.1 hypothetical protein [Lysinibacillus sphaericus]MBG9592527.1 hypothetical protein [Lysinibacillus sphaericus]